MDIIVLIFVISVIPTENEAKEAAKLVKYIIIFISKIHHNLKNPRIYLRIEL